MQPALVVTRGNLFQRTGEPPSVAFSVANAVFALSVRLVLQLGFHPGTAFARVRIVGIDIVYVDNQASRGYRQRPWRAKLCSGVARCSQITRSPARTSP